MKILYLNLFLFFYEKILLRDMEEDELSQARLQSFL
jgi:hypothetical protein